MQALDGPEAERAESRVGLCARCLHARAQRNARGNTFWRCARADSDPGFLRYPPLPVRACGGFESEAAAAAGGPEVSR